MVSQEIVDRIRKHLFESLPAYFHFQDSNKDGDGKGLVQRLFEIFEMELGYSYSMTSGLTSLQDPKDCPEDLLPFLGAQYSLPPTIFGDTTLYRKLLEGFPSLMQYKGTHQGLTMMFNLFGATLEIVDVTPELSFYDSALDHDVETVLHDYNVKHFFFIEVSISDPESYFGNFPGNPEKIQELYNLLYFMLPINVFIKKITIEEQEVGGFLLTSKSEVLTTQDDLKIKASL